VNLKLELSMSFCSTNRPLAYFASASVPKEERKKVFSNIDTSTTMLPPVSEKRHQDIFFCKQYSFFKFSGQTLCFHDTIFFREKIPNFFWRQLFSKNLIISL
jgi:hypothetical protein